MDAKQNRQVVERYIHEVFGKGHLGLIDELYAKDYRNHTNPPGLPDGPKGVKMLIGGFRAAFPDVTCRLHHVMAEGDHVAWHVESTGTQTGPLLGMPASGKKATWRAMSVDRLNDGRIAERWEVFDLHGLLQQLGAK